MQPQQPVIRTYRGRERRMAEEAYRLDAVQAERAAWHPVAHRWVSTWQGEELAVVFEYRGADSAGTTAPITPEPAPLTASDPALWAAPTAPEAYAEAEREAYAEAEPAADAAIQSWVPKADDSQPGEPAEAMEPAVAAEPVRSAGSEEPRDADPWADLGSALAPELPVQAVASTEREATPEPQVVTEPEATPEPQVVTEPEATPEVEAQPEPEPVAVLEPFAPPEPVGASAPPQSLPVQPSARPSVRAHARAVVQAIDLHAAGEALRLIRSGFPSVPSLPILERRRWLKQNADYARRVLMWEPRGHRDMYGAILLPPYRDDADIAVLFMHNEGYSTMCGHGIIAIATGLIEEGLYPAAAPETVIRFETPAGLVTATAAVTRTSDGRNEVSSVRFRNVPAYLHASGLRVRPEGVALHGLAAANGELSADLAFGGAYYGVVDAADLGLRVVPEQSDALTRAGAAITEVLRRNHTPTHPTDHDLGFVYGTIIVDGDPASSPDGRAGGADIRNVTIFADGEVDRSPCGSGTSALLAQMHALGRLAIGPEVTNAGITGEAFRGRIEEETFLGEHRAVITSVEGSAYVTGYHTFVVDDRDPLGNGFLLR